MALMKADGAEKTIRSLQHLKEFRHDSGLMGVDESDTQPNVVACGMMSLVSLKKIKLSGVVGMSQLPKDPCLPLKSTAIQFELIHGDIHTNSLITILQSFQSLQELHLEGHHYDNPSFTYREYSRAISHLKPTLKKLVIMHENWTEPRQTASSPLDSLIGFESLRYLEVDASVLFGQSMHNPLPQGISYSNGLSEIPKEC